MNLMKAVSTSILVTCVAFFSVNVYGQSSSYDQVYNILQTSCDGSSCHRPESSNQLKLTDTSKTFVYDNMINRLPVNPFARDSSGNKIVDPGNPANSFLLRKVDCGRGPEPALNDPFEGLCMPDGPTELSVADVDLIRVWIAGDAPDSGLVSGLIDLTANEPVVNVFPNPFSNSFSVTFSLDQSYPVKFELFDLLGKKVTTLKENETLNAGDYRFKLESPEMLPSGAYFLRMTVGEATSSTRVIKMSNR